MAKISKSLTDSYILLIDYIARPLFWAMQLIQLHDTVRGKILEWEKIGEFGE